MIGFPSIRELQSTLGARACVSLLPQRCSDPIPLPNGAEYHGARLPAPRSAIHQFGGEFRMLAFNVLPPFSNLPRSQKSCLLITLHYIDQMCSKLPRFTISSLTVHRFIIASVCVSTKALCDAFCTNSHYAKIGGIKLAELNVLEREFLSSLEWRLIVSLVVFVFGSGLWY